MRQTARLIGAIIAVGRERGQAGGGYRRARRDRAGQPEPDPPVGRLQRRHPGAAAGGSGHLAGGSAGPRFARSRLARADPDDGRGQAQRRSREEVSPAELQRLLQLASRPSAASERAFSHLVGVIEELPLEQVHDLVRAGDATLPSLRRIAEHVAGEGPTVAWLHDQPAG